MNLRRSLAALAALTLPAILLTTQAQTAEAATRCGENYKSVGLGPAAVVGASGSSHGQVDVQYNRVRNRWCFLVDAREGISFVKVRGAYNASTNWNVYGNGRDWKAIYLNSNGGKCVDAWAEVVQIEGETATKHIDRCRV